MDLKNELSICMVTYNNDSYIKQAIESVLIQKTNFVYELIISDDCSTDSTKDIVEELQKNHQKGNLIKYYRHKKNLTYVPNLLFTLKKCSGTYIAFLDSDDYWVDSNKLQKQYDFMNNNDDYVICFHDVAIVDGADNHIANHLIGDVENNEYTEEDILSGAIMPTATIFFRNCITDYKENIFNKVTVNGDTFLFTLLVNYGKAKYLPFIENSIRRIHDQGIWEGLNNYYKLLNGTNTYRRMYEVVDKSHKELIASIICKKLNELIKFHFRKGKYVKLFKDIILKHKLRFRHNL